MRNCKVKVKSLEGVEYKVVLKAGKHLAKSFGHLVMVQIISIEELLPFVDKDWLERKEASHILQGILNLNMAALLIGTDESIAEINTLRTDAVDYWQRVMFQR